MSLARFSIRQAVLVHLLFVIGMLAGAFVLSDMNVDVYPNVSFAQAKITTKWLGASARDVEQFITRKIEEEIDEIQGVDRIISHSQRDLSLIDVKFREDISAAEYESFYNDLRSALERVADLPEEAEEPILQDQTVNEIYPLIQAVVVPRDGGLDDLPEDERELVMRSVAKELRDRLQELDGVLRVSDFAIRDREYRVTADPVRLQRHGLTVLDVYETIRSNHVNLPAGPVDRGGREVTLRSVGEYVDKDLLLDLEIAAGAGAGGAVRLRDVATVEEGFERRTFLNRYLGKRSLSLGVYKREGADSLTVRDEVERVLDAFRREGLPEGLAIETVIDTTKVIKSRLRVLRNSLLFGIVLVFFLLWLFVGKRNSALAVMGVPFSFLLAIVFLEPMGITINAISLFSMVLVSGMIVDDAIIVIENIYRHVEQGKPIERAIVDGTREVVWPVVAATATTLAAFLPMLLMEGVTGIFLAIIPKTVILCLLASLVECFVILPAHYLDWGPRRRKRRAFDARFARFQNVYGAALERALRRPKTVIAGCTLLLAMALGLVGRIPVNLFPSDFQAFFINLTFPTDYSLEESERACAEVEGLLDEFVASGDVEAHNSSVGVTWTQDNQLLLRPNVSQTLLSLSDETAENKDPEVVINAVRERIKEHVASGRSEFDIARFEVDSFQDGPPIGKPVAVRVRSTDYGDAKVVAREIVAALEEMPGVYGIADNLEPGPTEVRLRPRRDRLAELGLQFRTVALTLRAANDGLVAGTAKDPESDDEIDIRVRLGGAADERLQDVAAAQVRLRSGRRVEVADVAEVDIGQSYISRYHYDTNRTVLVTADLHQKITSSQAVNEALEKRFADVSSEHPGVVLHFGGEFEETQRSFRSLGRAGIIALLLIYAILAAQFRSYVLPLVIMAAVPLAVIGVVLGLIVLSYPFTIMTFIAIVGLAGVAVNDSLVLVEFIENARRDGSPALEAIRLGCRQRLRAIVLTTATTVFGLLPMALQLTGTSKIWSPFAATISFGLVVASGLTLFLVPAIYLLTSRFRKVPAPASPARPDAETAPRAEPHTLPT